MWFFSRKNKSKQKGGQSIPFLRKALPRKKERRAVESKHPGSHIIGVCFLWGIFLSTLAYLFLFSPFVLIEDISVVGSKEISSDSLRGFVEQELRGSYFGIFPKRAYSIVRPRLLEDALRREFPLLASVYVERGFPNTLRVTVTERKNIIIWQSGEQSYLVDEQGMTHESTQALSPENSVYILSLVDTSNKPVNLGEKVLEEDTAEFVILLHELFPAQLEFALLPQYTVVSRFADEVRAKTEEGWEVYFNTDIPVQTSLDTLELLFEKELPREKRAQLAYIDLRAENRAYFAFRDGALREADPALVPPDGEKKEERTPTKKKKK